MEIKTKGVTRDIGVRCAENKFPWPPKLIKGKNSAIKQEISIEKLFELKIFLEIKYIIKKFEIFTIKVRILKIKEL